MQQKARLATVFREDCKVAWVSERLPWEHRTCFAMKVTSHSQHQHQHQLWHVLPPQKSHQVGIGTLGAMEGDTLLQFLMVSISLFRRA